MKRIYRESMLLVHPDKFSTTNLEQDLATELTAQLVNIYQNGTIEELTAFHSQLTSSKNPSASTLKKDNNLQEALKLQLDQLSKELINLKSEHLFNVLKTYSNPLSFIEELKEYYLDRIKKLKRRTRTK